MKNINETLIDEWLPKNRDKLKLEWCYLIVGGVSAFHNLSVIARAKQIESTGRNAIEAFWYPLNTKSVKYSSKKNNYMLNVRSTKKNMEFGDKLGFRKELKKYDLLTILKSPRRGGE